MDIAEIMIRSYALAVALAVVSLLFAARIRAGKPLQRRTRFWMSAFVNLIGFGLALYGLVPLWSAILVATVMAFSGGIVMANVPSASAVALLNRSPRKD